MSTPSEPICCDPQERSKEPRLNSEAKYRFSRRRARAAKVYTVNRESRYLIVQSASSFGRIDDIVKLFSLYGDVEEYRLLDEYPAEEYTDVYWFRYRDICQARRAKVKLDNYNYIGKALHVSYAPQFETVDDVRTKLFVRRQEIAERLNGRPRPAAVLPPTTAVDAFQNVVQSVHCTLRRTEQVEVPTLPQEEPVSTLAKPRKRRRI